MTLADLIPSLRSSLPRQLETDLWPSPARHLPGGDVALSGVSLRTLAETYPMPVVVQTGAVPTRMWPPADRTSTRLTVVGREPGTTVTLCRVHSVDVVAGRTVVDVGPGVGACPHSAAPRRAHLLNRLSASRDVDVDVRSDGDRVLDATLLPEDLVAGDLLALPAAGRCRAAGPARAVVLLVADGHTVVLDPGRERHLTSSRRRAG